MGLSLPPSLPHGSRHVPGGSCVMNPLRTLLSAASMLGGSTLPAAAQTPAAPVQPAPVGVVDFGEPVHDQMIFAHGILNQFEGRTDGRTPDLRWSGEGWIGTDYDKLWIKTEGFRRSNGTLDDGKHEFLYSRAISTYFDLQAGLRSDLDSLRNRNWAAFGLEGLAPYFFNVEGTAYARDSGHFAANFANPYDLLLTTRLIFQPEVESDL